MHGVRDNDLAVVFPGQGTQHPGMGRDFFNTFSAAKTVFEDASDSLSLDVKALCFEDNPRLDLTEYTQPALVTVEIAIYRALRAEFGFNPAWFAGHSLGEYTALCAAGVLSLSECVRIVRARGRLMQATMAPGEGAMLAVLGEGALEHLTPKLVQSWKVDLANLNAPDQIVVSGLSSEIARVPARLRARYPEFSLETVQLNVSTPFHSRYMRPVEAALRQRLLGCGSLNAASAPWVASNCSGSFHTADRNAIAESLALQASHPVHWIENMRALASN